MAIDLSGRVALVTGAAGGLGRAFALALARKGAAVVVNDLGGNTKGEGTDIALAQSVVDEITALGGRAIANADTVATRQGGEAMTQAALDGFGRIDIVISNAGNQRNARFEDMTDDDIDAVLAVHLKGAFNVTQPAYRRMREQGWGRIVLVSSQSGIFGNPYRANYGAAKTAMVGLMNVIAQEAPDNVHVNTIFPNASGSRMGAPSGARVDADFMAEIGQRARHVAHLMSPDYMAALAVFLCSDACRFSQHMYSVLGGRYARIVTGLTHGWVAGETVPTPEEVADHLAAIDDPSKVSEPRSGIDEMDITIARLKMQP